MSAATFVSLVVGLAILTGGGEVLVRGAGELARSLGLSSFVIGLTVVSFATSAPELAVTLQAALRGAPGLAVGNVVGSNIANVLLILGISALVLPLAVRSQVIRMDIPIVVGVSVLTLVLAADGSIGRVEGAVLVLVLAAYLVVSIVVSRRKQWVRDNPAAGTPSRRLTTDPQVKARHPLLSLAFVGIGVVLLVVGARLLVRGAVDVASAFGVSDLVIGLTVVSIGTSVPELATSVVAVLRGEREIAVGNVVGSCLFNIGAVLGLTGVLTPGGVPVAPAAIRLDLPIMIAVAFVLVPVAFTGFTIVRWEGGMFLGFYVAYVAYVLLDAAGHDAVEPFSGVMLGFVIPITGLWLALLVAYELGVRRGRREGRGTK
ncbi:MAG TPA: calcium/sodium antiporter [Jiangellaceae bacterium]|nr:calcium/sodium antiporter [Jiangellaceae bacterium]